MDKDFLSAADICLIIQTSAQAGVTELSFRDLYINFSRPTEENHAVPVKQTSAPTSVVDLSEETHTKQTKESIEADEFRLRREQMAETLITDPLGYEKMLEAGELTNDVDDSDAGDDEG